MISSFLEYISESSHPGGSRAVEYANDVINLIKRQASPGGDYIEIRELEYNDDHQFDLVIKVRWDSNPNMTQDDHFNKLTWEKINFDRYGFAVDANMKIDNQDLVVPEVTIILILNPDRDPDLYSELKYRLVDIITHELYHTRQIGWNRHPFNVRPSSNKARKEAKHSFKYFLLPDEVDSMVNGMYARSKEQDMPIDQVFDKYLIPFIQSGKITKEQYFKVLKTWVHRALELHPDALFTQNSEKIQKIIDLI
jgi:hypothetical protein